MVKFLMSLRSQIPNRGIRFIPIVNSTSINKDKLNLLNHCFKKMYICYIVITNSSIMKCVGHWIFKSPWANLSPVRFCFHIWIPLIVWHYHSIHSRIFFYLTLSLKHFVFNIDAKIKIKIFLKYSIHLLCKTYIFIT